MKKYYKYIIVFVVIFSLFTVSVSAETVITGEIPEIVYPGQPTIIDPPTEAFTESHFISILSLLIKSVITWLSEILSFIGGSPYVYLPILIFLISGGAVSLFLRFKR